MSVLSILDKRATVQNAHGDLGQEVNSAASVSSVDRLAGDDVDRARELDAA